MYTIKVLLSCGSTFSVLNLIQGAKMPRHEARECPLLPTTVPWAVNIVLPQCPPSLQLQMLHIYNDHEKQISKWMNKCHSYPSFNFDPNPNPKSF